MISYQLYNMERDLGINDNQYLIALTLFFFPYSLFEVCGGAESIFWNSCPDVTEAGQQCHSAETQAVNMAIHDDGIVGNSDGQSPEILTDPLLKIRIRRCTG